MNGVHDMGGTHGFGPVVREENEPLFHADWEARVRAIMYLTLGQGLYNLDAFRYGIEQMPPADYLRAPYYERWLTTVERNLIHNGVLGVSELSGRLEGLADSREIAAVYDAIGVTRWADAGAPQSAGDGHFAVGDAVLARNAHSGGHTRLPRYVRGKRGVVEALRGEQTLPDANAIGLGKQPQRLYKVRFEGQELWGESAEPNTAVHLDLWESYLEPAPT